MRLRLEAAMDQMPTMIKRCRGYLSVMKRGKQINRTSRLRMIHFFIGNNKIFFLGTQIKAGGFDGQNSNQDGKGKKIGVNHGEVAPGQAFDQPQEIAAEDCSRKTAHSSQNDDRKGFDQRKTPHGGIDQVNGGDQGRGGGGQRRSGGGGHTADQRDVDAYELGSFPILSHGFDCPSEGGFFYEKLQGNNENRGRKDD